MTDPSTIRAAVAEHGSQRAAARHLGIAESTLRGILKRAEEVPEPVVYIRGNGSKRAQGVTTPTAPQNKPKAAHRQPTGVEYLQAQARAERRRQRYRVAPFRRAFKGILPLGHPSRVMLDGNLARRLAWMRNEAGRFARQEQAEAREAVAA